MIIFWVSIIVVQRDFCRNLILALTNTAILRALQSISAKFSYWGSLRSPQSEASDYIMYWYVTLTELSNRESNSSEMGTESHLINIEILDNHEEATIGAFLICDLCAMVCAKNWCPGSFRLTNQSLCAGVSVYFITKFRPMILLDWLAESESHFLGHIIDIIWPINNVYTTVT